MVFLSHATQKEKLKLFFPFAWALLPLIGDFEKVLLFIKEGFGLNFFIEKIPCYLSKKRRYLVLLKKEVKHFFFSSERNVKRIIRRNVYLKLLYVYGNKKKDAVRNGALSVRLRDFVVVGVQFICSK